MVANWTNGDRTNGNRANDTGVNGNRANDTAVNGNRANDIGVNGNRANDKAENEKCSKATLNRVEKMSPVLISAVPSTARVGP